MTNEQNTAAAEAKVKSDADAKAKLNGNTQNTQPRDGQVVKDNSHNVK